MPRPWVGVGIQWCKGLTGGQWSGGVDCSNLVAVATFAWNDVPDTPDWIGNITGIARDKVDVDVGDSLAGH